MWYKGNFNKSLSLSDSYQEKLQYFYEHDSIIHKRGFFKDYDTILTSHDDNGNTTTIYLEVKVDTYANVYKSIAIEYMKSNEPSGISSTKADLWIHFVHGTNTFYEIPVNKLRQLIKKNQDIYQKKPCGDYNKTMIYVVPFTDVEEYAYEYNT